MTESSWLARKILWMRNLAKKEFLRTKFIIWEGNYGQYSLKVSYVPSWVKAIMPTSAMKLEEKVLFIEES